MNDSVTISPGSIYSPRGQQQDGSRKRVERRVRDRPPACSCGSAHPLSRRHPSHGDLVGATTAAVACLLTPGRVLLVPRVVRRGHRDQPGTRPVCQCPVLAHGRRGFGCIQGRGLPSTTAATRPIRYQPRGTHPLLSGTRGSPRPGPLVRTRDEGRPHGSGRSIDLPLRPQAGPWFRGEHVFWALHLPVSRLFLLLVDWDGSGVGTALRRTGTLPGVRPKHLDLAAGGCLTRVRHPGLRRRRGVRGTGPGPDRLAGLVRP